MDVAANADAHGCAHLWDVWNQLDYTRYRDYSPRFAAEFGWQAPPTWQTLRSSISDAVLAPDSPGMSHHQKATDGDLKLARGLAAHVGVPDDFDAWWFATQLMQARAVTTGIEHLRSLRGHCMGTIWWQINDCWPVTSWAVVDGGGVPKPAWFALRDVYRPQLITVQPRGSALVVFAVNDSSESWVVEGTVRRLRFDGTVLADAGGVVDGRSPVDRIDRAPDARSPRPVIHRPRSSSQTAASSGRGGGTPPDQSSALTPSRA